MTNTEFTGKLRRLAADYNMLPAGGTILCAVSGGKDSMALLHALYTLEAELGFSLHAAHYNHNLRGAESQRDATFVEAYCREKGIPFTLGSGDVAAAARVSGRGIEETARDLRYAFLEDVAKRIGASRIATAHQAEDNLETLLLNLIRGTGLRGLGGIPPVRGAIVRPLLTTTREEIEAYLTAEEVPFVEDSSNGESVYRRNRLRHEVLPVLRELNPRLTESATATIRSLREDEAYLEARALEVFREALPAEEGLVLPTKRLSRLPSAIAVRVIRRMLEGIEASAPTGAHIAGILEVIRGGDPSASIRLPGGVLVQRVYEEVLFAYESSQEPLPPFAPCSLNRKGKTEIPGTGWSVYCEATVAPGEASAGDGVMYLRQEALSGALTLRPRQAGDILALPGRRSKSLKKLMIEEKLPRRDRERIPVLDAGGALVAVAGLGPQRDYLAKPGELALALRFQKEELCGR